MVIKKKTTKSVTRQMALCPIFGTPSPLMHNILPTYYNIMQHFLFVRNEIQDDIAGVEPKISIIMRKLAKEIISIWSKASLPTISEEGVVLNLVKYHKKYVSLKKSALKKNKSSIILKNIEDFLAHSKTLFCISSCKCKNFDSCTCSKDKRVPIREQPFLIDQRSTRKMFMGQLDLKVTASLQKKHDRIDKSRKFTEKVTEEVSLSKPEDVNVSVISSSETPDDSSSSSTEFLQLKYKREEQLTSQKRITLPTVAECSQRIGMSDRATAMLVTATLKDVGIISDTDLSRVVDRSKIKRAKMANIEEIKKVEASQEIQIEGLYFDGRKDDTIKIIKKDNKIYKSLGKEEHVVLLQEPESKYIGYVCPSTSSATSIKNAIISFIDKKNIITNELKVIGCDGTNVNTGIRGGVIRLLEVKLGRALQWSVCQLHGNELPLRHLIQYLDGSTKGPYTYSGPLGISLSLCEQGEIIDFEPIDNGLSEEVKTYSNLSSDQKYLLEMSTAVSEGYCPPDLANRNPGKLAHSRWVTAANRFLRLYVSTDYPSDELKEIVTFIQKVYVSSWFKIKMNCKIKDGALNWFHLIKSCRYLSADLKSIVNPVIQRNAYFLHPENLLLAMISDQREEVKLDGWSKILQCRENVPTIKNVRLFKVPAINFAADDYHQLIDWNAIIISEPPLTKHLSYEEIRNAANNVMNPELKLDFPCHTQAVERCIKLVTDASSTIHKEEDRHFYVLNKLSSIKKMPKFESKKDFNL